MARYGQTFKDRALARLLPPESAAIDLIAREVGIGAGRLEAVVTTAAMNEADKSAWCRSHGAYPEELAKWRASATTALAAPEELRASPQATRQDRKRIKELVKESDPNRGRLRGRGSGAVPSANAVRCTQLRQLEAHHEADHRSSDRGL